MPHRRRRTDDTGPEEFDDPAEALTTERRLAPPVPAVPPGAVPSPPAPTTSDGHVRVAEILAENGVSPTGSRRRRRYREDDEPDDVLARVLGRR